MVAMFGPELEFISRLAKKAISSFVCRGDDLLFLTEAIHSIQEQDFPHDLA